jgi:hypothetical protein
LLTGGVATGSWTGISVLKALANGSVVGVAATAIAGSASVPKSTKALPKAASNMLPPTALPLPSDWIGLRKLSTILRSDGCGPNSTI